MNYGYQFRSNNEHICHFTMCFCVTSCLIFVVAGKVAIIPLMQMRDLGFRKGEATFQICMTSGLWTSDSKLHVQIARLMFLPIPSIFLDLKMSHLSINMPFFAQC